MIISISGRIGVGKDEVSKIIQKLTTPSHGTSSWKNMKWADSLKEMCSLLLRESRSKFEDQKFKSSILGDEWNTIGHPVIFDEETQDTRFGNVIQRMTVREFMERIGDGLRKEVHPDIWINSLMSKYKLSHHSVSYGTTLEGDRIPIGTNQTYPDWIISDTRYMNEVEAVISKGGINIRIERPDNPYPKRDTYIESALDEYKGDYLIINDGTLDDLEQRVREILTDIKVATYI